MEKQPKARQGFQKGQSGNPLGRTPLSKEVREANKITKSMILDILGQYLTIRMDKLEEIIADPQATVIHRAVATISKIMIETGDHQKMNWFMDRLIGKVTDKIEHSGATPVLIEFSSGEKILLGSKDKDDG